MSLPNQQEPVTADTFLRGLWEENPVFVMLLGMCPVLAVTNSAINALAMGLATTFVLLCSSSLVSLMRKLIPKQVRIATSTKSFLQSSFLLYIVPLIALVVGAITGKLVGENVSTGLDPNLLSAVFGVFFMAGSFVILRVGSSVLNKESYMPKIIEIVREEL